MLYALNVGTRSVPEDAELEHDNALEALIALRNLIEYYTDVQIIKDGIVISAEQLEEDADIQESEQSLVDRLPATCQPGFAHDSDISIAHDGRIVKVRRPENPEDRFE